MSLARAIPGMHQVLRGEPPEGSVIVVLGPPGSIKTGLIYNLMANALNHKGAQGACAIHITLDESRGSILRNLTSLHIPVHPRIQVSDLASFVNFLEETHAEDLQGEEVLDIVAGKVSQHPLFPSADGAATERLCPRFIAIDSLNGLIALTQLDPSRLRRRLSRLLFTLRQQGMTSFLVLETTQGWANAPELHLADGVIELGFDKTPDDLHRRFIWVRKMRATPHSVEPFLFEVTDKGLSIVGVLIGEPQR